MQLLERSRQALEYGKVLELLAAKCHCADAEAKVRALLPCGDAEDAQAALRDTEDACRLSLRFGSPSFYGLKNVDSALERAKLGSSLGTRELLDIKDVLYSVRTLARYRDTAESVETALDPLFDRLTPNKYLEEKIGNAIVSEDEISDNASEELAKLRRGIRRTEDKVRQVLEKMVRSQTVQKFLQDPIITIRSGRFVLPVRSECRSDVPGLVHDTSASGATLFVEPMGAVEANNELRVLQSKEEKEIERILAELSNETGGFAESIAQSVRAAVELDFVFAKAELSFSMKAGAPVLAAEGGIVLHKARHPLIPASRVVPIDLELGGGFDTLVVTGPNTGGKTVALKTLGLLTLMAMSGLMVPAADDSRLVFFRNVLADIGDEQSIEQSLSTFSAHMTNIVEILSTCRENSLVLLDELGAGTDPVEGAALAVSILEHLRECGAKTAATTHYAELKAYAIETPRVENASCEFDLETLRPTYRLLIGVPGRSNAFAISARLGLSTPIIERAKSLISSEDLRFEEVVRSLDASRQGLERERAQAQALHAEAEESKRQADELLRTVEREKEQEIERARQQARRLLESSRAQAQALMDDLDALRKMRDTEDASKLRELAKTELGARIRAMEEHADPVRKAPGRRSYKLPRPLRAGDTVLLTELGKQGTVLRGADRSGNVEVQAGIIKTRVPESALQLVEGESAAKPPAGGRSRMDRSQVSGKSELDLRGQTVDEALLTLDRFLDNAQLAGIGQVTVIHGKGTGALRSAVQQHLRGYAAVASYRLGRYGEGEDGVTIVELK